MARKSGELTALLLSLFLVGCDNKSSATQTYQPSSGQASPDMPRFASKIFKRFPIIDFARWVFGDDKPTVVNNNYTVTYITPKGQSIEFDPDRLVQDYNIDSEDVNKFKVSFGKLTEKLEEEYDRCRDEMFDYGGGQMLVENEYFIKCVREKGINENAENYLKIKNPNYNI